MYYKWTRRLNFGEENVLNEEFPFLEALFIAKEEYQ